MDHESLYKDQYDKSLAERAEINGSLSMPIGILTALLAALYFCTTNFNYDDQAFLVWIFTGFAVISIILLGISVYYLVWAFADFLDGREYFTLNDANRLNSYFTGLLNYYGANPPHAPITEEAQAKADFDEYLLQELIRNASMNQRVNRTKRALLFQSHKYMIYAIISLSLLIIPFGIDFGLSKGKEKVEKERIDQALPVDLHLKYQKDTTVHIQIKPRNHVKKPQQ